VLQRICGKNPEILLALTPVSAAGSRFIQSVDKPALAVFGLIAGACGMLIDVSVWWI
jgi:hypothetical protein